MHLPLYLLHVDYMITMTTVRIFTFPMSLGILLVTYRSLDVELPRNASLTKHSSRQGVIQLGPPLKDRDRKRKSTSRGAGAWFLMWFDLV